MFLLAKFSEGMMTFYTDECLHWWVYQEYAYLNSRQ